MSKIPKKNVPKNAIRIFVVPIVQVATRWCNLACLCVQSAGISSVGDKAQPAVLPHYLQHDFTIIDLASFLPWVPRCPVLPGNFPFLSRVGGGVEWAYHQRRAQAGGGLGMVVFYFSGGHHRAPTMATGGWREHNENTRSKNAYKQEFFFFFHSDVQVPLFPSKLNDNPRQDFSNITLPL